MNRRVRVLIADDSRTARALLRTILEADPAIVVVAEAVDGEAAARLTGQLRPDLVLMDIDMPGLDGFEATRRIMVEAPTPIVVVSGRQDVHEVGLALRALRAGALSIMAKPPGPGIDTDAARRLVMLAKAMADVHVVRQHGRGDTAATVPDDGRAVRLGAVGVAASTGGPAAISGFLRALPTDLGVPVLVVQHIAEGFDAGFAAWLQSATSLPVALAVNGMLLKPGCVYVGPHDRHLEVAGDRIRLTRDDPVRGFRPSADVLFRSLADRFGAGAGAVVLTGMGEDGVDGAAAVHAAGGLVLAQDEASSAVFGMPKVVGALAELVGPVERLAARVASATTRARDR